MSRKTLPADWRQQLVEFWPTLEPIRVLADAWGCSEPYVSLKAKRLGLPSRRERAQAIRVAARYVPRTSSTYLTVEAVKRGTDDEKLCAEIIRVVIRDKLVGAILDDQR